MRRSHSSKAMLALLGEYVLLRWVSSSSLVQVRRPLLELWKTLFVNA